MDGKDGKHRKLATVFDILGVDKREELEEGVVQQAQLLLATSSLDCFQIYERLMQEQLQIYR